ncbi:MAG: S9 family peptidase [Gudongella sp.]|nr:S9 family peptidase [Gudongella sp.]
MENLELKDFVDYKSLSNPTFSPNGENLAFNVHCVNLDDNKYNTDIFIWNKKKGIKKLTSLGDSECFLWKNNKTLLFKSFRDKIDKEKKDNGYPLSPYYEIDIDGGEARKAFQIPLNVSSLYKLNKDEYIVIADFDQSQGELWKCTEHKKQSKINKLKDEKSYEVLDEIPFWSNGEGFTNKKRNRLYYYTKKNNELTEITDEFTNVISVSINNDKSSALFICSSFIDKMSIYNDLFQLKIDSLEIEKISPLKDFEYVYANYIDDKIIFLGKDMKEYGVNENPNIYITHDLGKTYVKISEPDISPYSSVNSDVRYGIGSAFKIDGDYLYFIATKNYSSDLFRVSVDGNIEQLLKKVGSIDSFDISNGEVIFVGLRELYLQELYRFKDKETKLTKLNQWVNDSKLLSNPQKLTIDTKDGEITGWVLSPTNFEENKNYPGILYIHGGPKTVFGTVFTHELQVLANNGYFVFFLNPRGSDGYGNAFADIRGKYGLLDYSDIMNFVDSVLEEYPAISKTDLGVAGGSYGGYMTNWIIGHTNKFKAAVSQRSISNWISFFGNSDIGYYFTPDQTTATPWNNHELLWNNSPLKYADKVETPTLFIHSQDDYRCWLPEGVQMFTALKYHGVESKLVLFKGENHELSRSGKPKARIKRMEEILTWFDKFLKRNSI